MYTYIYIYVDTYIFVSMYLYVYTHLITVFCEMALKGATAEYPLSVFFFCDCESFGCRGRHF